MIIANQIAGGLPPEERAKWLIREQFELQRLQAAYPLPCYEIESGATEDGDPWCAVCNSASNQVVVHIARIGCKYVIVHSEKNIIRTFAQIKIAIDLVTQ